MEKSFFVLQSHDCRQAVKMEADDLMSYGIPRSTAYRAIKKGSLPRHRLRELQFKVFGQLPGWDGWTILPGKIVSPNGFEFDQTDLENLNYLRVVLSEYDISDLPLKKAPL